MSLKEKVAKLIWEEENKIRPWEDFLPLADQIIALIGKCGGRSIEATADIIMNYLLHQSVFAGLSIETARIHSMALTHNLATPTFSGGEKCKCGNLLDTDMEICPDCVKKSMFPTKYCNCMSTRHYNTGVCSKCGLPKEPEPIPAEKKEEKRFGDICLNCGCEKILHNCPECGMKQPEPIKNNLCDTCRSKIKCGSLGLMTTCISYNPVRNYEKPKKECELKGDSELWDLIVNYFPAFGGEEEAQNKRSLFEQVSKLIERRIEPKPKDRIEFKFCSHGDEHTIDIAELTQRINERE
jgi:hypothetical protein